MVKQFIIRNTNLHIIHYLTMHYVIYLIYFKKYLVLSKICVYLSVICNFITNIVLMKKILIFAIIFLITSCTTTKTTLIENGREGKGNLKNNLKQGKWIFYKDGKINSIGNYSKNKMDGIWRYYHPNEKLHQKGKFVNDKQNGIWNYYFESGEFMGEGELVNDLEVGIWKWYHKNGKLYTERYYEDGNLMEIKSCFEKKKKKLNGVVWLYRGG